jgi:hypothetical protein
MEIVEMLESCAPFVIVMLLQNVKAKAWKQIALELSRIIELLEARHLKTGKAVDKAIHAGYALNVFEFITNMEKKQNCKQ